MLDRLVAVKVLHSKALFDKQEIQRFHREAKATFGLAHENVVAAHDFGVTPQSLPYLVMDYVPGTSLAQLINSKALDVSEVLRLFLQICEGLKAAHANGIVHRDLKPSNVLITAVDGERIAKISDFGIAKITNSENATLTGTGEIVGSPPYMSPEQCTGRKVDCRSDIYSAGCLLFEALTGRPPFIAETPVMIVHQHMMQQPPKLSEVSDLVFPEQLETIVSRALAKSPERRYQHMAEMAEDIRVATSGGKLRTRRRFASKQARFAFFIAVLAMLMLIVGLWAGTAIQNASKPSNPSDPEDCYQFAQRLFQNGDYARAETWFKKSAELSPQFAEAWWGAGECERRMDHSEAALALLNQALKLSPDTLRLKGDTALVYIELGKYAQAEILLRNCLSNLPADVASGDRAEYQLRLGIALMKQRKLQEAEQALRDSLASDPGHHDADSWLKRVLVQEGKEQH
jgi:serine/threonine protein kinase